jgi:hypothetical protein
MRDVVWWEAIAAQAKHNAAFARSTLREMASTEYAEHGSAPTWRTSIATASLSVSSPAVTVSDAGAFTNWVSKHHPDQLMSVVRESWQRDFLARIAERGDPPCDSDGQIIPGLTYIPGGSPRSIAVRQSATVKAHIASLAESVLGSLTPALGSGDGDE